MTQEEAWLLTEKYNGVETDEFVVDCRRLASGEPLAYIIGHVPFLQTMITLASHPLIPRAETEYWVERAIHELNAHEERPLRILDLCAGSGCIGIAVLAAIPDVRVDFADSEVRHLETIHENIRMNTIDPTRAQLIVSNLFTDIPGTYDAILTNPPYIDPALDRTENSVRTHEPSEALYGGKDGLFYIREIIRKAPEHLTPRGVLYLEHEPEQASAIQEFAHEAWFSAETFPDQYGTLRFTRMTRKNPKTVTQ